MQSFRLWSAAAIGVLLAGPALAAPAVVVIRHAAARIVVIPEARSDVKIELLTVNPALPLTIQNGRDGVEVDGDLRGRIGGCTAMFGKTTVRVAGLGQVSYDNLPQILARVPLDAMVDASGAVFGAVARSDALELSNAGCGDWTVANVRGVLKINEAGSGDIRAGAAGTLEARVAGSGDVMARQIAGGATIEIAGSGDVTASSISGPLKVEIAGSGDVKIEGGHASDLTAHLVGSGGVRFAGVADSVNAFVAGSGDVDVAKVTGPVKKSVVGSGDVNVGP